MRDKLVFTDVHGCGHELQEVISSNIGCDFISLGDNFDRSFDGVLVYELLRDHEVTCVMGNHDLKLLDYLRGDRDWIPKSYQYFLKQFTNKYDVKDLISFLEKMKIIHTFDIATRRVIAVHAGIRVDDPLLEDVSCNVYGRSEHQSEDWWNFYHGKDLVLYGHITHESPVATRWDGEVNSICLDTGVCHGKKLSAMRLSTSGSASFISVNSKKDYFTEFKRKLLKPSTHPSPHV